MNGLSARSSRLSGAGGPESREPTAESRFNMTRPAKLTPMLEQYFEIKRQVPDAILFYRLGDFYEMFFEGAERAAPLLALLLTARHKGGGNEAPTCGVPDHAPRPHLPQLI